VRSREERRVPLAGIDYAPLLHASEPRATDDESWVNAYGRHMKATEYKVRPVDRPSRMSDYNEFVSARPLVAARRWLQRSVYGDPALRSCHGVALEDSMTTAREGAIVLVHRQDTRNAHRQMADARIKHANVTQLKEKRKKRELERREAQVGSALLFCILCTHTSSIFLRGS